jgi:hypothetical protein
VLDPKLHDDPVFSEFVELVSEVIADFTPHPEFPDFRIPRPFTPLDPLSDHIGLDPANLPDVINTPLFLMEWNSLPGYSSFWHLHALATADSRVYWVDDIKGRHIVATGPCARGADRTFAQVLFASNGQEFGTGIIDSAPSRISTPLGPREFLIDLFIAAFGCSANGWNDIDGRAPRRALRRYLKRVLTVSREAHL